MECLVFGGAEVAKGDRTRRQPSMESKTARLSAALVSQGCASTSLRLMVAK
jgi:hypothetical protein